MQKGYYKFFVIPVSDKTQIQEIKECLFDGKIIFPKLQLKGIDPASVEKGCKVFEIIPQNELKNYISVQTKSPKDKAPNEKLPAQEVFKVSGVGEFLISDGTEQSFYTVEAGLLTYLDEIPSIIPIHLDSIFEIIINEKKSKLDINFYPPYKDGKSLTCDDVIIKLNALNIKSEQNTNAINEALCKMAETQQPVLGVNITNGIDAVDGKDGYIEYFIFKDGIGPTVDKFGRTDYHNLNLVIPVEKDQKIIEYHPAVQGIVGRNIFGEVIQPKDAEKCLFPSIENTYKSPENSNLLLSKIDGSAFFKRSNITISADYSISGDIDYHTGNIHTNGSVRISGDVKSGFQLDIGGNLYIGGCVEDAVINCKGSVTIKEGFIGTGEGIIKCDGTVKCHFINQQTIYTRDSIVVEGECIDANLYAKNSIKVGGTKISIVGGYAIAGKIIETEFLGNMYTVKTVIEAGYDYELKDELKKNKLQLEELNEKFKKVKLIVTKLDRLDELNDEQQKMFDLMKEQNGLIEKNLVELEKRNEEINKLIRTPSKAMIKVKKTVFPGVIIAINSHKLIVQDEYMGSTFGVNDEGEIINL